MNKLLRLTLALGLLSASRVSGQNLVAKPDFGTATSVAAAPADFTTQLTMGTLGSSAAGQYLILPDASKFNSGFTATDHTVGSSPGVLMAVDGPSSATTIVWQQTITVQSNRTYTFSYWQRNLNATTPANLQLQYKGNNDAVATTAGTFSATGTTWQQKSYTITTGSTSTQLTLTLTDLITSANGNDFGLDDMALVQTNTGGIAGTVFEDVNYGGGAGRPLATATSSAAASGFTAAIGRPGAKVELYSSTGVFLFSTTTDAAGFYNFPSPQVVANTSYTVRVVSGSVSSARAGYVSTLLPIVTYSGGIANRVGGPNPALPDAPANPGTTTLAALTSSSQAVQAFNSIAVGSSGNATGTDFGFNFDLVVNTKASGQGSLAQFIVNSNALGNESTLAQAGSYFNQVVGAGTVITPLPAATESSIFSIPDGAAHGGLRAYDGTSTGGPASQLTSGVATIALTAAANILPALTGPATVINGWTQAANTSNTNNVTLGAGTTAGVNAVVLPQLNAPEIQLNGNTLITVGLDLTGAGEGVTGLAIYGFGNGVNSDTYANLRVSANNVTLFGNIIGASAASFSLPSGGNSADGVRVTAGTGLQAINNLIGFHKGKGLNTSSGVTGATISLNEIRGNNLQGSTILAGVDVEGSSSTIQNNLVINNAGIGLDGLSSAGSNVWTGNTVTNNGIGNSSTSTTTNGNAGIRIYGTGNTVSQNLIYSNYGAGVRLTPNVTNTTVSQNSIYKNGSITSANGSAATGDIGIDLQIVNDNQNIGATAGNANAPYVTLNGSVTTGTNANGLVRYPILQTAKLSGTSLTVTGIATTASTVELFIATPNAVSSPSMGNNFGQGSSYLGSMVIGSGTTTSYGASGATINGFAQGSGSGVAFTLTISLNGLTSDQRTALKTSGGLLTSTATLNTSTSEFSGNVPIMTSPTAYDVANLKIGMNAAAAVLNPGLTVPQAADDPGSTISSFKVFPATNGTLLYNGAAILSTGQVVLTANTNLLTFQPTTSFTGTASFPFTATNAAGTTSTNTATYSIPVVNSNGFVANDDGLDAPQNTSTAGNVLLNDGNAGNVTSFTVTKLVGPTNGTLTLNADGSYTYTPNNGYLGADSFQYQICQTTTTPACSNIATVSINVFDPSRVCNTANGSNLLQNPGFETGNDGSFTSAYTFVARPASAVTGGPGGLYPESTYAVDADAHYYHASFTGLGRGGSGNFMIVNGDANQSKVYAQVVNVIPNRYYNFSGYAQSVNPQSPAVLGFVINGKSASVSTTLSTTVGQYQQFSGVWYSGANRTATFEVRDINRAAGGNDFGLDDLYFGTCSVDLQAVDVNNSPGISYTAPPTSIAPLQATLSSSGVSIASFVMQTVPTLGSLRLGGANGTTVVAGQIIPYSQRGSLYYVPNGSSAGTASFKYTATDSEGAGSSNTATYTIPVSSGPLPVTLTDFTAQASGTSAQLYWHTASELNNAYFTIERSTTGLGTDFVALAQVAGQGTVATGTSYQFTDRNAAAMSKLVYYRLRQVDVNGTAAYSPVRVVSFVPDASSNLTLYPNPVASQGTALDLSSLPAITTYQVRLLDATGRTIRQWALAGGQPRPLAVNDLASGSYLVLVSGTKADGSQLRQVLHLTKE
ncbi:Ig-like domain-containing protein [Hymenobacter baengnokdamensis]|uniref:Ig-like domain-containing protein n=1 Tax=Hymenobacter baengnokdamensis TaxID=2615203 RepID=UPI001248A784|nr:Ig-like domain-containing protein [Hymenobacter baengnokdamensis]